jgi:hypothetical protein
VAGLPAYFLGKQVVHDAMLLPEVLNFTPPQDSIFQMKINISHHSGIPSTINFQKKILNNN